MKPQTVWSTIFAGVLVCLPAMPSHAASAAASAASPPATARRGTVNDDAMTVKDCRNRLAMPKSARPRDDDPNVDLDAVCRNILDSMRPKAAPKRPAP